MLAGTHLEVKDDTPATWVIGWMVTPLANIHTTGETASFRGKVRCLVMGSLKLTVGVWCQEQ